MMKKKLIMSFLALAALPMMLASCNSAKDNTPKVFCKVNFMSLGTVYKSLQVEKGKTITEDVPDPVNKGYDFDGWYIDQDKIELETYVVINDATLWAHWVESTNN